MTALPRRVDSVDLLRGIVMVIMMLDHTRDFVHAGALQYDPTDLSRTYPALFFTRWITHFCAPIFVFLAGTGAYLQGLRGKSKRELSRFLVTRGLWLIVLEFTLVRAGVFFEVDYGSFLGFFQVIWVFGVSMICLAGLIHLPLGAVAAIGIAMILLHNLLDDVTVTRYAGPGSAVPGFVASLWILLHQGGFIFPLGASGPPALVLYPLIPWIGVMAAGYVLGSVYEWDPAARRSWLLRNGALITLGFIVLRLVNFYGDPGHWSVQSTSTLTVLSFFRLQKYPPSLLYLMMTLGPALVALALFETRRPGRFGSFLVTFGRVPLFFYLLQWPVVHGIAIILSIAADKPMDHLLGNPFAGAAPPAPDSGFSLAVVYGAWVVGVLLLYPLCRWFAGLKARRRDWWLSYI